ncbi:MAG: 5'-methylthioadenosine/adenosylhomocysteine nucleosidase [Buchnera aphidicola (Floraphis meitanensis)]
MKIKKNVIIGIIGATDKEIIPLYKKIKNFQKKIVYNKIFYSGKLNNIKTILVKSGVGKVSSSTTCTILLNIYKVNLIINIGTAGSLDDKLIPGNIILPHSTCYHDVDLTAFGYKLGHIQNFPKLFSINKNMIEFTETHVLKSKLNYKKNLIISGDSFINNTASKNILKKNFPTAIAVDMESTAIAQVCYQFKKPFLIIKSISDYSDNNSKLNFEKFIDLASQRCSNVVQDLLNNIYKKI